MPPGKQTAVSPEAQMAQQLGESEPGRAPPRSGLLLPEACGELP